MTAASRALVVFLKAPIAGLVKTRLLPQWSAEAARDLYRAMVEDLLERLDGIPEVEQLQFYEPPSAERAVREWLGEGRSLQPQRGRDLGDRMDAASRAAFARGYRKVVLAGSDVPDLDRDTIESAFAALERNDVVVGPALDGGYYLIGLRGPRTALFREVEWGSDGVLRQTVGKAEALGLSIECLQPLAVVDTPEDARRLWSDLRSEASRPVPNPRTEAVLQRAFTGGHGEGHA